MLSAQASWTHFGPKAPEASDSRASSGHDIQGITLRKPLSLAGSPYVSLTARTYSPILLTKIRCHDVGSHQHIVCRRFEQVGSAKRPSRLVVVQLASPHCRAIDA